MSLTALLEPKDGGLFCKPGQFAIDPWEPAELALITHAHADHARPGSQSYIAAHSCVPLLKRRLGDDINIRGVDFGEALEIGRTRVSFHPAGHVLGSAQIRVEHDHDVWVFTGDFKRDHDPSAEPFELVPCNTLITEATFALPIYKWESGQVVAGQIFQWWQAMKAENRPAVLFAYSLGKAQRVLAELLQFTDESVYLHGAVANMTEVYRNQGIAMLPTHPIDLNDKTKDYAGQLIIAPPGASGSAWMRRFKNASTGFCSGWMRVRGNRRRRGYDRGFVLSDHADWSGLLTTVRESGAQQVLATHGRGDVFVRFLKEQGYEAEELSTRFAGESDVEVGNETTGED